MASSMHLAQSWGSVCRESDVVRLVPAGRSDSEIAARLQQSSAAANSLVGRAMESRELGR